jgi:hypothetical protein
MKLDKKSLDETIAMGEDLLEVATSFNQLFAARGWVASGATNTEAAKAAMAAARQGRWTEADEILAEACSADLLRLHIRQLDNLRCFEKRVPLAMLALDDYEAGRYHACVPIALALLDGMGKDLTGAGFFRQSIQLDSKESFLEIGPGAAELFRTMSTSRKRTTTEPITIPFRPAFCTAST